MTPKHFDENLLTNDAYATWEDYRHLFLDRSCYCSATPMPPCSICEDDGTHPGNPDSLLEDDSAWDQMKLLLLPQA